MFKGPRRAYDRGFVDGIRSRESDRNSDPFSKMLNDHVSNPYKGDREHPESYRHGFKEGRK